MRNAGITLATLKDFLKRILADLVRPIIGAS
jgi:hypothetical protein